MRAGGRQQLLVAAEGEADAVLDGQPGVAARRLHGVDDLAGQALAAQLVVEDQVERHRVRALALELVALQRLHDQLEVVGAELVVVAVDRDPDRALLAQRRGHVRGVQRRHRRGHLGHPLAEARARASRKLGLTS